jgi:hypothetical protein
MRSFMEIVSFYSVSPLIHLKRITAGSNLAGRCSPKEDATHSRCADFGKSLPEIKQEISWTEEGYGTLLS